MWFILTANGHLVSETRQELVWNKISPKHMMWTLDPQYQLFNFIDWFPLHRTVWYCAHSQYTLGIQISKIVESDFKYSKASMQIYTHLDLSLSKKLFINNDTNLDTKSWVLYLYRWFGKWYSKCACILKCSVFWSLNSANAYSLIDKYIHTAHTKKPCWIWSWVLQ